MIDFARFLQFFTLGTWIGAIIFLSFVEAPGAFSILSNRDEAGKIVGYALTRLHYIGIAAAVIYIAAGFGLPRWPHWPATPAAILVFIMLVLTLVSEFAVRPRMARLRSQMTSIQATPSESPLRVQFDRLHRASVWLEAVTLLIGIAALVLTASRIR